ncbi:MAG: hypothetical protein JWL92_312 [Candidatus Nomurabacteria bacterium]|nr:hypothetical protein [Candidatus Nomurabacteria bacterium]
MSASVNQRLEVLNGTVEAILNEGFSNISFHLKPLSQVIQRLEALKSAGLSYFRKVSKGIEACYEAEIEGYIIVVWTSYLASKKIFREDDQIWILIIDHRNKDPFFSFPINRYGDFYTRMFNTGRVYKVVAKNMVQCKHCDHKLSWTPIRSDDFEEIDEHFHDRTLICINKNCEEYRVDTKMLITDMPLPSEKDRKFFAAPFVRSRLLRKKNQIEGKQTIPRRLIRYFSNLGIKLPRKTDAYTDLEHEKQQKGKVHLYNEEAIESLLYHDERQNENHTHED